MKTLLASPAALLALSILLPTPSAQAQDGTVKNPNALCSVRLGSSAGKKYALFKCVRIDAPSVLMGSSREWEHLKPGVYAQLAKMGTRPRKCQVNSSGFHCEK